MRASTQALLPVFLAVIAFGLIASLWQGTESVDYGVTGKHTRAKADRAQDPAEGAAAEEENQVLLRGRLADAESGEPVCAPVSVFEPGGAERSSQAGADGVFQIGCARPGRVTIAVPRTENHFGRVEELELKERMGLQRFVLQPRRDLPVLLRTSDGRALSQVVPPPASWVGETWPSILITPVLPSGRDGEGSPDPLLAPHVGTFLSCVAGEEPRRPGSPEACVGYVRLYQAPPVRCSLMLGSRVLQTLQISGAEKGIGFIVDPAELKDVRAELELRVIDAATGLPPEARRGLWLGMLGCRPLELPELDRAGRLVLADVPAGAVELHLRLTGYEQDVRRFDLRAGERNDLGELRLQPAVCVAGHVVGEAGEPVSARVWSSAIDGREQPLGQATEPPASADWFAVCGLPRTAVLVGIDDPRWAQNPVEIDLANGSVQNERIVAHKGKGLRLVGPSSASGSARLRVLDARGLCVWYGENLLEEVHELRLLPGKYTVEVRRGAGSTTRQEVDLTDSTDDTILLR